MVSNLPETRFSVRHIRYKEITVTNMKSNLDRHEAVTLKTVASYVGYSTGTVSAVLNDAPSSQRIPQATKDRIIAAAHKLNYRPNILARSLRKRRTHTIGVISPEIGNPYCAMVTAGIEQYLRDRDYLFIISSHHNDEPLLQKTSSFYMQRGVEGLILMDMEAPQELPLPSVNVGVSAFSLHSLASTREPLERIGEVAARTLLAKIEGGYDFIPAVAEPADLPAG
jgi:DNA-binding LacI/PurR family transcriptional regulator